MDDLSAYRRLHLIGVAGSGMSALAKLLGGLGYHVTGSDLRPSPVLDRLGDAGIDTWVGSRPELAARSDLVVASSAVPARDPEIVAAAEASVPVWSRPRLLQALTRLMPAVGVTGTHGKTTSTAMLVTALRGAGEAPSFVVGGDIEGLETNAAVGTTPRFVLEIDEAFGTFLDLYIRGLVITNIEADHLDFYGTVDALEDAFVSVARRVDGPLLACIDDPGSARLADRTGAVTYGTSPRADVRIVDVHQEAALVRFLLVDEEDRVTVEVPQPGLHTARNAAGVLGLVKRLGVDVQEAARALAGFKGVRRRFERRGTVAGVTVIDDYAHHPTEITATLAAAAAAGTWRSIWAVFQPHRYTRTRELHREFGPAFVDADHVIVTDVYAAGEAPVPGVTGELVADAARARTEADVHYIPHRSDLAGFLVEHVESGDLVLSLGAGDITLLASELLPLLEAR